MAQVLTQEFDDLDQALGATLLSLDQAFSNANYTPQMLAVEQELAEDHAGYFNAQSDSTGEAWKPLAPATVKRKGHPIILIETNEMRSSIVNPSHGEHLGEASERGLTFGTYDEKAPRHQTGTRRMPARPPIGVTEQRADAIAERIADATVELLKQ